MSKTGKMENKFTSQTCIKVSLAVLGLFKTPEDVVAGLNRAVQLVEDDKIQIKDKKKNVKQQYLIMKQCSAQEQYRK